ncbi:MAG: autotransporter outer membrane beta-barrel domain-containing protein, partial [Planctomycetaceae bacterium]|nr:autotransporter outer membrane beta-barrel domain-containing protein [Planctomycetaceae bacterium]
SDGIATINAGTFKLENTTDSFNAGNTFTLKKDATVTGNGTVQATTINLGGKIKPGTDTLTFIGKTIFNGSTLTVDLSTINNDGTGKGKIDVTGTAEIGNVNTITIDNPVTGLYNIITADTLSGGSKGWELSELPDRVKANILETGNILQLNVNSSNLELTWSGNDDTSWNVNQTKNWFDKNDKKETPEKFLSYDAVTFDGRGQGTVEVIDDNGYVMVAAMNIKDGVYHFTGGDIYGYVGKDVGDGSLNISGGDIIFEQAVVFEGGITIDGKAVVELQNNSQLASGENFTLGQNATLNLIPYSYSIVAGGDVDIQGKVNLTGIPSQKTEIQDVIVAGNTLNQQQLRSKFNRTWGLNSWEAAFSEDNTSMSLLYDPISPYRFADIHKLGWNVTEAARAVTEVIDSAGDDSIWSKLDEDLHELNTDEAVTFVLDNFRGTEQAADALTIALWDPWTKVYQQLLKRDNGTNNPKPVVPVNGQAPGTFQFKNRNVWIEGYYRYTDVNSDKNAKKYYENRGGLMMGLDTKIAHFTSLGLAFGFGDPRLTSQFGKIEADDYTLALYSRTRINSEYLLNTFIGFGTQEFKYRRNDALTNEIYNASYDGNAFYASAELLRSVDWSNTWTLYPTAALDYQRSWAYSFIEEGGTFGQSVRKGDADRFIGRFGVDSKYRYSNYVNILTRLQYGYLIGGDTHTSIRSSFTGTTPVMTLHGIDLGKSQFNLGIGGEWFVDEIKSLKFFGNYDIDFGKRHAMQTAQIGVNVIW